MAASDFLFSIGSDSREADAAVQEFIKRTRAALSSLEKINTISSAGAQKAISNQQTLLKVANQRLAVEEKIASQQTKNAASGATGGGGGYRDISAIATRNATAIGKQKDALDFLNRIMGNTVFKFIEYELVMKAFNGAVSELMNSLNQASNVQMEMVLQRIYNAQINTNAALKDAIIIAKQWGSDITDVQQAIGLWTKQTSQMHDASGKLVDSQTALAAASKLAADAEKFHRASGIESLEVYQKSISLWHELGLSLGQIPHLYDQIALAATKISPVLKAQPGTSAKQEGIKDIFEGVAESGATLRSQGMDDALIIATVAKQVENLGSTGAKVGTQISTMFGSLNQGGKQLQEWVKILGPDAFKDSEHFMDAAISKVNELKQAQADGLLHVKPQTMNTWRTFIETLDEVKKLADEIRGHSKGMLDVIAGAQMNTYNGEVARLRASFQELNLALGTQLLPTATHLVSFLSGTALPVLAANSTLITRMAAAGLGLGASYLVMLGITKVSAAFAAFRAEAASAALAAQMFRNAELDSVPGMEAAEAEMLKQQAALAQLERQMGIAKWQAEGLNAELTRLGITETELAEITATRLPSAFAAAGTALTTFGGKVLGVLGPLLRIYGVMQLIGAGMGAFDARSNLGNVVNEQLLQKEGTGKDLLNALNPLNFGSDAQNVLSTVFGKDKGAQAFFSNRMRDDANLRGEFASFTAANKRGDKSGADQSRERIVQLLQADFDQRKVDNVKGYEQLDKIDKHLQDLMNRAMGGNPLGMTLPGDLSKGKSPKLATEQQIAAEAVNKDKADAMAQISHWRDVANAAASYIKTLEQVAKQNGFTSDTVQKLAAAFKTQNDAIFNGEAATKKEITNLQAQKQHLDELIKSHHASIDAKGNVTGGDRTSALYAEAKAWRMADEAIVKAKGNLQLYNAQRAKLSQEKSVVMGEAEAWADIAKSLPATVAAVASKTTDLLGHKIVGPGQGAGNPLSSPGALTDYLKTIDQGINAATTNLGKAGAAGSALNTLDELTGAVYKLYTAAKTPEELKALAAVLVQIRVVGDGAKKTLTETDKVTADFNRSITDLLSSVSSKNAGDMGKLLGLDSGTIQSQQTLIDGYRSMNDELTKLNDLINSEGGSYANLNQQQQAIVQGAVRQIELQQQLLPLLQQQQEIQSSIAYQATESALQKAGEAQLDATISRLMGHDNNAETRKAAYDKAVSGQSMSAMQSLFKDYLTNVVQNWWSQTVKSFTNSLFGDPAAQARELERKMLENNRDGLTLLLQNTKTQVVDALNEWEKKFAADVAQFTKGGGGASSSGSDIPEVGPNDNTNNQGENGPLGDQSPGEQASRHKHLGHGVGTDSNPLKVSTVGDGSQGLFSGTTSQSNMAAAVAAGVDQSETMKKVADNTGATSDTAGKAASVLGTAAASPSSSGSSGNLLQGLLGPFGKAIPGLDKYLSSNGSWLNSIANGAGQGFGIGSMIGGAGSTNSEWGAIGGALGSAAAFIPGIGPALAAALPAIGGILGGIFGHQDDPSKMPDKYDTQNYGKFVANINGRPGSFNGVTIGPDPQFSVAGGNHGMGYQMIAWAQKNPNDPLAKQIMALGPQIGIASEKDGIFTLGDGKTISVTAYEQLGQQWQAKAQNQSNAPIISVNSYGGGSAAGAYDTPGLSSSEFQSEEQAWAQGTGGSSTGGAWTAPPITGGNASGGSGGSGGGGTGADYGGGSAFNARATPGYGDRGSGLYGGAVRTDLRLQVVLTTPVNLDGKKLTELVNAYNAQMRSDGGHFGGAVGHDPYE